MNELKILMNCGIGDCIVYRSQLLQIISNNNNIKIYLSPNETLIDKFVKYSDEYKKFINDFCKLIFIENNFIITKDQSYPQLPPFNLYTEKNILPHFIDLSWLLEDKENKLKNENYIVIHTKAKLFDVSLYDIIVKKLINFIRENIEEDIILLGEREKNTTNNNIHIPHVTCNLYNDIINNNLKNKIIDMSLQDCGENYVPNINKLIEDAYIINKAKINIVLGLGGDLHIASSFGNVAALIDSNTLNKYNWNCYGGFLSGYFEKDENKYLTDNYDNFIENIKFHLK